MSDAFHEPVSLADPDPDWPSQYAAEAAQIERELRLDSPHTALVRPRGEPAAEERLQCYVGPDSAA